MQIGYILFIFLIVSVMLAFRLRDKVSRIFSIAAICSFFLVLIVVAALPAVNTSSGSSVFVAGLTLIGIVFTVVVLINILFQNLGKKSEVAGVDEQAGEHEGK